MKIHIATDHAGMELSGFLISKLSEIGYQMIDHGPAEYNAFDDYPGFCIAAAQGVAADRANGEDSLGIVLGGSGNGEQMAANKVAGIRAALIWNAQTAKLAREHNDAQVCAVGARQHTQEEVLELVTMFLSEPFSADERHQRRISKIQHFENTGEVEY